MANRIYGESRLTCDDGRELTLRFDFGALVEAEEAADINTQEMMEAFASGKPRLKIARAMLYGALRFHHPDYSVADAGELLMTDSEAVSGAMGLAMKEMAERRAKNPPPGTAAAAKPKSSLGIGTRSSRHGSKAA